MKHRTDGKFFRAHAAEVLEDLGGGSVMQTAGEAVLKNSLNDNYVERLADEAEDFIAALFKSPETQKMLREACRRALSGAIAEVLEQKRAEMLADVAILVGERWREDVEQLAHAAMAEELARLKRRLTGGGP